jgi:hypothetical protein
MQSNKLELTIGPQALRKQKGSERRMEPENRSD